MGALAPADRRDALDLRQARALGRTAADRPSRSGDERRGIRPPAFGRARLWADRGALYAHGRPRRRRRAEALAAAARRDRRGNPEPAESAELRRRARRDAPPGAP